MPPKKRQRTSQSNVKTTQPQHVSEVAAGRLQLRDWITVVHQGRHGYPEKRKFPLNEGGSFLDVVQRCWFWSCQSPTIVAEYEALRQKHLSLVGQSQAAAVSAPDANQADETSTPSASVVELESVAKLEESIGIEHRAASEINQVELIQGKDKSIWLLSSQNKTVAKHCILGGYGTGQWVPEAECAEPGVPFKLDNDRSVVQLDEGSFSAEAQGCQTLTVYKLLLRAETEKHVSDHRMSFLQITRKPSVQAGEDGFDIQIKNPMTFRCLRDPRTLGAGAEERVTSKNFFSKCLGTSLAHETCQVVFRYRFERVGQSFKIQRPYVITSKALTLQKDKPLKLV
eukprot:Skav236378  [mRNA]  locus=scaffold2027:89794:98542:- [translate_table: standard]